MDKISLIKEYIQRCEEVIDSSNVSSATKLSEEIVGAFWNDIEEISSDLTDGFFVASNPLSDVNILKQKLRNLLADKLEEKEKRDVELELARLKQPVLSATANVNNQVQIDISITQIIENVRQIPEESLSANDKELLMGYLCSLEGMKMREARFGRSLKKC